MNFTSVQEEITVNNLLQIQKLWKGSPGLKVMASIPSSVCSTIKSSPAMCT